MGDNVEYASWRQVTLSLMVYSREREGVPRVRARAVGVKTTLETGWAKLEVKKSWMPLVGPRGAQVESGAKVAPALGIALWKRQRVV